MLHLCVATGCDKRLSLERIFCKRHWSMVPSAIRNRIFDHYRLGQCYDRKPSSAWLEAVKDAVLFIREAEDFKMSWRSRV